MSARKKLRAIAAMLPPAVKVVNGKPVMVGKAIQLENHEKNILSLYESGGQKAVEAYVAKHKK